MIGRGIWIHVALLSVAASVSILVWTRDKKPAAASVSDVNVWSARPADVDRVVYESKGKKITLEGRKDARGRYFVGTSETIPAADAGAVPPKIVSFVSVSQADKLANALAPLKALRDVGKIGDDRAAEFGLKDDGGSVAVVISGKERKLKLGASAPGNAGRYVRDEASGIVYALKGDILHDLELGESGLTERQPHDFKDSEIRSVRVIARGKTREVLHSGPDSKRIWAAPSTPDKADETIGNFISMIDRLRPTDYLTTQPSAPEVVVRLEYQVTGAEGAFLEIAKVPAPPADTAQGTNTPAPAASAAPSGPKSDFLVRSERTRLWAKSYNSVGEQVEQDLGSVLP